jgi:hypothetical protein
MATIVSSVMGGGSRRDPVTAEDVTVMLEMAIPACVRLGMYRRSRSTWQSSSAPPPHRSRSEKRSARPAGAGHAHLADGRGRDRGTIGILLLPSCSRRYGVLHHSEQAAGTFAAWYQGIGGQLVSVIGLFGLVAVCYLLARKGARWQMEIGRARQRQAITSGARPELGRAPLSTRQRSALGRRSSAPAPQQRR